ncbi:MAG: preprotein translocase subunit SecY [Candidatus Pacebacteria bacterium]|jgi:preprotein translocase subunit SecY|nr:preprotein translocase subunit SecY [Candidatus Paceibacterota bacterium]
MSTFFAKLKLILTDASILRKLGYMVAGLILFRLMATIPLPGIDHARLEAFFSDSALLGFLNVFSGGGLSNLSIMMLGVAPYITASIIMQLGTVLSPKLKALYSEEGELGRKQFAQYSRLLSVPLAVMQGVGLLFFFQAQGIVLDLGWYLFAVNVAVAVAGSMLLMWIGELITEYGIGNGLSLIIFAGIVASLPSTIAQLAFTFDPSQIPLYVTFVAAALAITFGVVYVSESERPIPVTYAKRVMGNQVTGGVQSYVPLRLNQAGVMPIIFALSILTLPQIGVTYLSTSGSGAVSEIANLLLTFPGSEVVYAVVYFFFVILFTYFFTAITFDPTQMANNLQKNGAFVPGVRPGQTTAEYIGRVITRITLVGALFLGVIAVLPLIIQNLTGVAALAIGGTALLIIVSVVLDVVRKIDAQLSLREY